MAAARGRRRPGRPADHVRPRRHPPPARSRTPLARRLRNIQTRSDRQRRLRPAATRRLGGDLDGLALARELRSQPPRRRLGPASRPHESPGRQLDPTRQRPVGDARSPAATSPTPKSWPGSPPTGWPPPSAPTPTYTGPPTDGKQLRDTIHADVLAHGYDPTATPSPSPTTPRAWTPALLMIPRVGFLPPTDPRVLGTIAAIQQRPHRGRARETLRHHRRRRRPHRRRRPVPGLLVLARRRPPPRRTTNRSHANCSNDSSPSATTSDCSAKNGTPPPAVNSATPPKRSATSPSSPAPSNSTPAKATTATSPSSSPNPIPSRFFLADTQVPGLAEAAQTTSERTPPRRASHCSRRPARQGG